MARLNARIDKLHDKRVELWRKGWNDFNKSLQKSTPHGVTYRLEQRDKIDELFEALEELFTQKILEAQEANVEVDETTLELEAMCDLMQDFPFDQHAEFIEIASYNHDIRIPFIDEPELSYPVQRLTDLPKPPEVPYDLMNALEAYMRSQEGARATLAAWWLYKCAMLLALGYIQSKTERGYL